MHIVHMEQCDNDPLAELSAHDKSHQSFDDESPEHKTTRVEEETQEAAEWRAAEEGIKSKLQCGGGGVRRVSGG